jgi:hypothetical protein
MAQDAAEREAGLKKLPPGMIALRDLYVVWPEGEQFMPTRQLVTKLLAHNPDYWGADSPYGKPLTDTRLGLLIDQATKVTSIRPGGRGPRGYLWRHLVPVWVRLGIGRIPLGEPGRPGEPGEPGADMAAKGTDQLPITGLTDLTGSTGLSEIPTEPSGDESPRCDTGSPTQLATPGTTTVDQECCAVALESEGESDDPDELRCSVCGTRLERPESIARGHCAECHLITNTGGGP